MSSLVSFVHRGGGVKSACLPALLTTWMLLAVPGARAEPYAAGLSISDEADLRALYEDGALTEEEFETLRELLRTGVDVRTASREAARRRAAWSIIVPNQEEPMARIEPLSMREIVDEEIRHACEDAERQTGISTSPRTYARNPAAFKALGAFRAALAKESTLDPVLPFHQTNDLPPLFALHRLSGIGHMLIEEAPDLVTELIRRQLR